jgi:Fur family ferric uptake transcriptional regulator
MVNEMNRIKEMIRAKGYKLTPQRRATLDVILRNEGKHMSTEEVFQEVKKTCPEIGLATVYRTMLLLEEAQILQRHNFDDGKNRYELKHPSSTWFQRTLRLMVASFLILQFAPITV